jgi:rhamnose transport system permease protein
VPEQGTPELHGGAVGDGRGLATSTTPSAGGGTPPSAPAQRAGSRFSLSALGRWETLITGLIVVVLIVGSQLSDKFLTADSFTTGSFDMIEVALIALPMTLVIITGEIDLSVASILGLSSALMGKLWNAGLPIEEIMVLCLVMGGVCGFVNGFLVTRVGLPSLAVTIGTMGLYRGLALVVLGDQSVTDFPTSWTDRAFGTIGGGWFPNVMVIFVVLAVIFAIVLHFTPYGRSIYAIGANEEASRFAGIRVKRVKMSLYVVIGIVSALAGIVMTLRNSTAAANVGVGLELVVVAAVLLGGVSIFGGKGSLFGVILAVILLGAIQKALLLANGVSSYWIQIVEGALLVGSVLGPNLVVRAREARARATRARGSGAPRVANTTTTMPHKEEDR